MVEEQKESEDELVHARILVAEMQLLSIAKQQFRCLPVKSFGREIWIFTSHASDLTPHIKTALKNVKQVYVLRFLIKQSDLRRFNSDSENGVLAINNNQLQAFNACIIGLIERVSTWSIKE